MIAGAEVVGTRCVRGYGKVGGAVEVRVCEGIVRSEGFGAVIWRVGRVEEFGLGTVGSNESSGALRKSGLGMGGSDLAGKVVSFVAGRVGVSGSKVAGLRVNVG
jgi:hypothetical protein